jgi:hypothetical protein
MLWADAETDDTGRDSPQKWKFGEQAHSERRFDRPRLTQYSGNDPALHGDLQPLRHASGELATPLDLAELGEVEPSFPQRFEKNIGCGHGILDREIDADAADRRHGMGGIANTQQTRPKPIDQPVHANR